MVVDTGALGVVRRRRKRLAGAHLCIDPRLDVKVPLAKSFESVLHPFVPARLGTEGPAAYGN